MGHVESVLMSWFSITSLGGFGWKGRGLCTCLLIILTVARSPSGLNSQLNQYASLAFFTVS